MTEIANITLENEMDLIVAYKRMITIGEYLKLSLTTQTSVATAIVEVSREVIDKTDAGYLSINIDFTGGKYFISSTIFYPVDVQLTPNDSGVAFARKLVPEVLISKNKKIASAEIRIGIPRSIKLSAAIIQQMQDYFKEYKPATPYEELKAKNIALNKLSLQQNEQLKYSRYLDAMKTEFISTASHELKTPLTTILAFSQMLLSQSQSECSPSVRKFIEKIHQQSVKLQTLIQQLLDVSKMETNKMDYNKEQTVFFSYIHDIIDTLKLVYPSYKITIREDGFDKSVFIDKLRIEQVLTNLIGNAAKYSEAGSNIDVGINSAENGTLKITITDEGIGISDENLEHIFGKFYRENQAAYKVAGLGIGLYITKIIVEEHGGNIWAQSNKGHGSVFTFTIPIENEIHHSTTS